jgi:hypothetical protein
MRTCRGAPSFSARSVRENEVAAAEDGDGLGIDTFEASYRSKSMQPAAQKLVNDDDRSGTAALVIEGFAAALRTSQGVEGGDRMLATVARSPACFWSPAEAGGISPPRQSECRRAAADDRVPARTRSRQPRGQLPRRTEAQCSLPRAPRRPASAVQTASRPGWPLDIRAGARTRSPRLSSASRSHSGTPALVRGHEDSLGSAPTTCRYRPRPAHGSPAQRSRSSSFCVSRLRSETGISARLATASARIPSGPGAMSTSSP